MRSIVCLAVLVAAQLPAADPECFTQSAGNPSLRAEGQAEQLGNLLLFCVGGTPTSTPPTLRLDVFVNPPVNFTSRILDTATSATEALLLIDEPSPGNQTLCQTPLQPATCPGANVIPGISTGLNRLSFFFPFNPPGNSITRVIRVTNLSIAAAMSGTPRGQQTIYSVMVSLTGTGAPILRGSTATLGIGQVASNIETRNASNTVALTGDGVLFSQCTDNNAELAQNPGSSAIPQGFSFRVRFDEVSPAVFRRRTVALPVGGVPPPPQNQDQPGMFYGTESGFFKPTFPGVYQSAGLAQSGTRLVLRFPNVPAGVELYTPVTSSGAVRTNTNPDGSGAFVATVAPNTLGLAPLSKIGADQQAVFEILTADISAIERIEISVLVAYRAGQAAFGTVAARLGFAPISNDTSPNSAIIPRFSDNLASFPAFAISTCRTLTPSPTSVQPGGTINVAFSGPAGSSATDWIGLYAVGAPDQPSIAWRYTNGAASGSLTFTAPQQPGQYEFRYFLNDGYSLAARSAPVTVSTTPPPPPPATRTLAANPSTVTVGSSFLAQWTAPSGSNASDWIGLYAVGAPDSPSITWHYTGVATTGSLSFMAPNQPGQYELRYFLNDSYNLAVKSGPITVTPLSTPSYSLTPIPTTISAGGNLTINWNAPTGSSVTDWIGLYAVGSPNNPPLSRQYTAGATTGSRTFTAPSQPGQYEFRYFTNDTFNLVATSAPITVTSTPGTHTLNASPSPVSPGGNLTVTWSAPAGSSPTDWIGLFAVGAADSPSIRWRYTNGATSGSFNDTAPSAPGQYEYRYFLNDGYALATKSSVVTVGIGVPGTHTLTASPTTVPPGTNILVSWTAPTNSSTTDWVGMYPVGAPDDPPLSRQFTNGAPMASFLFTAPSQPGQYEFRYFLNNTFTFAVRSQVVTVTTSGPPPPSGHTLTANPTSVTQGAALTVNWTAPAGSSSTDWVGLFFLQAANTAPIVWQYTGGATSGGFSVSAPAGSGQYEFRYLLNDGYSDVVRSSAITINGTFAVNVTPLTVGPTGSLTVTWTAPPGRPANDWVGLYAIGAPNRPSIWWQYTGGATSGTLAVPSPPSPGQYELRYLVNNTYIDIARSAVVTRTP